MVETPKAPRQVAIEKEGNEGNDWHLSDMPFNSLRWLLADKNRPYAPPSSIIMCNHLGNADGFVLRGSMCGLASGLRMIYKASLDLVPLFGWSMRLTGDFSVKFLSSKSDDFSVAKGTVAAMMDRATKHLNLGLTVGLFPEGVRSADGRLQPFRDGFFRLAVDKNFKIFPIAIVGSATAWPVGSLLVDFADIFVLCRSQPITPQGKTVEELKSEVAAAMTEMVSRFEKRALCTNSEVLQKSTKGD